MINILKKEKYFLIILFLFSFLIRAAVFHFYLSKDKNYWQVDSKTYHKIAVNLSQGNGICADKGTSNFYRLPGYPLFLSAYYKLFDVDTKNVLWIQIFLASLIPILIFLLSLVLFPMRLSLAKAASLYSAFHLGFVLYSGFFMTESLFVLFFLLFCILFFSSFQLFFCRRYDLYQKKDNFYYPSNICYGQSFIELYEELEEYKQYQYFSFTRKKLFLAGIFLGVASLIRPVGHYLIILSVLSLFFSRTFFKEKIKKNSVLFMGWFFVVFAWLLRNYLLLGQVFFHTLPGGHFLYFSAARVAMHPQQCSYQQSKQNLMRDVDKIVIVKEEKIGRKLNEIELSDVRGNLALKYFKKYPIITLKNWMTDILRTSLSLYSAELVLLDSDRKGIDYFAKGRKISSMFKRYLFPKVSNKFLIFVIWFEILTYLFILLGFAFGFVRAVFNFFKFRNLDLCVWLKVLPFISLFIVIGLSGGFNRMRLPAEPFIIILALSFWLNLFKKESG